MAGGTRLSASKRAPVLTVTEAPKAILTTTTSVIAANQVWITLDRVISFKMWFTWLRTARLVGAGLRSSESQDAEGSSVDPVRRRFQLDEPLTGLGLAPQSDRPPQEPPLLRRPIFFDQLRDAGKPFG